ncbi:SGNH/GDSL hydrolase family protein [Roseimaritima multifibrata]|uniref:SGNH/GDSL hydrolase family protein n=1 Tax=Roseimaritima multifibrata TaxID=1930274 RepID=UPI00119FE71C|nr:SGNH/GDSL hydrolase family protein [Roseimaritima multifibrata]
MFNRFFAAAIGCALLFGIAAPFDSAVLGTVSVNAAETSPTDVPDLKIGTQSVNKILFIGNSITRHGPAPKIGWTGNWGMAATSEENDYVHLLLERITQAAGGKPQAMIKNVATFERSLTDYDIKEELKQELAFNPDLIVVAIGENAVSPATDEAKAEFATAFANLFTELTKQGKPTLFVRSSFWHHAEKDNLMKQACENAGGVFIDISDLDQNPANFARAEQQIEHAGVAAHPGDKGMQAIADAIWSKLQN